MAVTLTIILREKVEEEGRNDKEVRRRKRGVGRIGRTQRKRGGGGGGACKGTRKERGGEGDREREGKVRHAPSLGPYPQPKMGTPLMTAQCRKS